MVSICKENHALRAWREITWKLKIYLEMLAWMHLTTKVDYYCDINCHKVDFIVISVYRPPNSSSEFFFCFENLIKSVNGENKEFHILGDLNCDMLKDDSDPPTIILKGILESYQLFKLITEQHE